MKVIREDDRLSGELPAPQGRFAGRASQRLLLEADHRTRASYVHFEPGAHTHWHTHSGGQVLQILAGSARVQAWGEQLQSLNAGDTVVSPPDEKHWHGAAAGGAMTHLAITSGEVTWLEDVETE